MNLKRIGVFFASFVTVWILLSVTGCATKQPYAETRNGNYLYLNPFSYKPATSQEHWEYASKLKESGHLKTAGKQFNILAKRWPESVEAPSAKQNAADLYFARGKNKKAFDAYEELIAQYYTQIKNYDAVLERELNIAEKEVDRKRMRWLFGGYRAPERAVPLFESIIKNAPQWGRAPEIQYQIGQAYQKNDDLELAIVAYSTVEYRYPDSPFAEKAAFSKIECFKKLVKSTPNSLEIHDQAQLSAGLFPELYPKSNHLAEVKLFDEELTMLAARYNYEVGEFYERVPRPPKPESAAIYYRKTIANYGGTEYALKSAARLRVLFPVGETLLADGTKAPILLVAGGGGEPGSGGAGSAVVTAAGGEAAAATGSSGYAAVRAPGSGQAPLPERMSGDDAAVEVTADRMEYAGDLLIAEGSVAVQQPGASLQADRVTVNYKTGEIVAAGNILMIREGARWEGQNLVYNYKTREGDFGPAAMYFEPAYITAERSERISTNEFVMYNVMMTTCEGDKPAIYAKAKEARVTDSGKPSDPFIRAKHVTFYIGPVPVFYTPVWQRHLGYRVFTYSFGYGGRVGAFAKVRAELHPTEWMVANSHFDVYADRGIGVGQDFYWKSPGGKGRIETYHIDDRNPVDDNDPPAEQALTGSSRYRVKLVHQERFSDETYFKTELNRLSDPGIIEDFFHDEFLNEANPENFAVVQHATENYGASVRVDHRLNDFYTTVERLPAVNYDLYRTQLSDTPFYFESENSAAFLELLNAQLPATTNSPIVVQPDDYRSGRLDSYNRIFLPLKFRDFFNVIPRAGYRGTWYSDTPTNSLDGQYRNIMELGVLTSFKAYKPLTEKSGFFGTGLRHVAEPYADYSYRPEPNVSPTNLYQFDDIDALDKQNEIRFGERNFLQTKRGLKRIANFLDSDVYTTYRFNPGTNTLFGPLVAKAQMSLTDNFNIYSDLEYDWYTKEITPANARLEFVSDDQSAYSVGYRYDKDDRSLWTTSAKLFPNSKWSYEFGARYDSMRDEWEERKVIINHKFSCIGMGVGYKSDEDDVKTFWVQFWLTAFPQSTFGGNSF